MDNSSSHIYNIFFSIATTNKMFCLSLDSVLDAMHKKIQSTKFLFSHDFSTTYPHALEMMETPYFHSYSHRRRVIHKMVTSKYFDLAISAVIGLNVITMAMEFYMMPTVGNACPVHFHSNVSTLLNSSFVFPYQILAYALKVFNYFFTAVFILEAGMKVSALGLGRYMNDRY